MIGCINAVGNYVPPFLSSQERTLRETCFMVLHQEVLGPPTLLDGQPQVLMVFIGTIFGTFHQAYKTINRRQSFVNYR